MSSWTPTKYKTTNWSSYNDSLKRRGSLSIWFDPEMVWMPPPSGKRGRQRCFSDAAIQACLTLKVLFGMLLRQTTGAGGFPRFGVIARRDDSMSATGSNRVVELASIIGAIGRNEAVNASRYLGRVICRRWSGYHRRSRVETKLHCVKLLGQSLMARDFGRQVAEIQIRVAVLNKYTALGIPAIEVVS